MALDKDAGVVLVLHSASRSPTEGLCETLRRLAAQTTRLPVPPFAVELREPGGSERAP